MPAPSSPIGMLARILAVVAAGQLTVALARDKQPPANNDRALGSVSIYDIIEDDLDDPPVADASSRDHMRTPAISAGDGATLSLPAVRLIRTLPAISSLSLQSLDEHSRGRAPPTSE